MLYIWAQVYSLNWTQFNNMSSEGKGEGVHLLLRSWRDDTTVLEHLGLGEAVLAHCAAHHAGTDGTHGGALQIKTF